MTRITIPLLIVSLLSLVTLSSAQDSSTPEALIKSIYAAHRPWDIDKHKETIVIDFGDEKAVARYFDQELVRLFQSESACLKKAEGYCSLDQDPIFLSQDSATDDGYEIGLSLIKETDSHAEYEVTVHWAGQRKEKWKYLYILHKTGSGWRVSDIRYGDFSIKDSMTRILKEYGF
jgi:hypothetical protein